MARTKHNTGFKRIRVHTRPIQAMTASNFHLSYLDTTPSPTPTESDLFGDPSEALFHTVNARPGRIIGKNHPLFNKLVRLRIKRMKMRRRFRLFPWYLPKVTAPIVVSKANPWIQRYEDSQCSRDRRLHQAPHISAREMSFDPWDTCPDPLPCRFPEQLYPESPKRPREPIGYGSPKRSPSVEFTGHDRTNRSPSVEFIGGTQANRFPSVEFTGLHAQGLCPSSEG